MTRLVAAVPIALALAVAPAAAADTVTYTCDPAPGDCSGWYREPVRLTWSVPSAYDTEGCDNRTYSTDTAGTDNHCRATNGSAVVDTTVTVRVDQTPPVVAGGAPDRPPDAAGWYTSPVGVRFGGSDATSGLASCTDTTYSGPDSAAATVSGTCTDVAGNTAAPFTLPLQFDATPPAVAVTRATGDREVRLRWTASADAVRVTVTRDGTTVFAGAGAGGAFRDRKVANGRRYAYRVTETDAAGNAGSADITARPARRLLSPARRARTGARPQLTWTPVRGARYYNVQLFHHGRKVLTRWPHNARYRPQKLRRGTYTWYVWPGKGAPAARRYGALIGRRTFTVS
jgi:hypothetical protein